MKLIVIGLMLLNSVGAWAGDLPACSSEVVDRANPLQVARVVRDLAAAQFHCRDQVDYQEFLKKYTSYESCLLEIFKQVTWANEPVTRARMGLYYRQATMFFDLLSQDRHLKRILANTDDAKEKALAWSVYRGASESKATDFMLTQKDLVALDQTYGEFRPYTVVGYVDNGCYDKAMADLDFWGEIR